MTTAIQGIATTAEKTQVAKSSSNQEDQGNIINHQMTCSMGHAIYTMHSSTAKEYLGTQ
jgi:hypothetical protein